MGDLFIARDWQRTNRIRRMSGFRDEQGRESHTQTFVDWHARPVPYGFELSRDDSVGFAPHLLGLRLMCFVVRHLRIWLQYARASRLAHQPNPLRI